MRRLVSAHVTAMLKERDPRGLPLTDDQVYLIVLGHYGITCPHPRYEVPTMCDASQCAICGGYVTAHGIGRDEIPGRRRRPLPRGWRCDRALHRPFEAASVDAGRELFNDFGERDFSSGLWE